MMFENRELKTEYGEIRYWVCASAGSSAPWLVFLPGLTADHHLFDPQLEHFSQRFNCLTWDPPNHGVSRPWTGGIGLDECAELLMQIMEEAGVSKPVLVGQSNGGYLSQMLMELYPRVAAGFVSVDSCPLRREYYAGWEIWALKHTYGMYMCIPWGWLVAWAGNGVATTDLGKRYMKGLMRSYAKRDYCRLAAQGYRALAEAVDARRPYRIDCPVQLICGEEDRAGSAKRYNREWTAREGFPMAWIPNAGHNSTLDAPEQVNGVIDAFLDRIFEGVPRD